VERRRVRALVGARGGDVAVKPGVGRPGNGRPYEGSSLFRGAQDWERKTRKTHWIFHTFYAANGADRRRTYWLGAPWVIRGSPHCRRRSRGEKGEPGRPVSQRPIALHAAEPRREGGARAAGESETHRTAGGGAAERRGKPGARWVRDSPHCRRQSRSDCRSSRINRQSRSDWPNSRINRQSRSDWPDLGGVL